MTPQSIIADAPQREEFSRRFADFLVALESSPAKAAGSFLALRETFDDLAQPLRRTLLESPLAWSEEEKNHARWLHRSCDDFASFGYELSSTLARTKGLGDEEARAVVATTLFFMGETVKWDVSVSPDAPHDLRKVHALLRLAMDAGHHRDPRSMRRDERDMPCTLESLYFRVLLLARFASGVLNNKQIEILDAWMWRWMPVLTGVPTPPPGAALRADLDSSGGLQRGPRDGDGPSLYIPQGPIEAAYRELIGEFHAGRVVPAEGIAAEFRVEEHIAVLDLIRHGLHQSQRAPVARAPRRAASRPVEIFVGLADIMARGFAPPAPVASGISMAPIGPPAASARLRERDDALGEVYGARRKTVRLVDESDTGLGIEGAVADCGSIAAGDLIGVRLFPASPLVIGKVVRSAAAKTAGRVFMGVRRLTAAAQLLDVRVERTARPDESVDLLVVPGADTCGRHDACLVSERAFAERSKIVAHADNRAFSLRLNRVRERGRGWVLAGFEVLTSRPCPAVEGA
jgi:hypothetical protein